jgi:feruloyl esterase
METWRRSGYPEVEQVRTPRHNGLRTFRFVERAANALCEILSLRGRLILTTAMWLALTASVAAAPAVSCEALATLAIPHTTITSAEAVTSGNLTINGQQLDGLPAFCRITAFSKPTADSNIRLEVWLPAANWNGKFLPGNLGSGIPAGIRFPGVITALRNGYATGATGSHESLGDLTLHPERITDWVYRGTHELASISKSLITAYYGDGPKLSLINECGGGSVPALNTPPRFPEDYDAVAVGGYSTDRTHMVFGQLWPWVVTHRSADSMLPKPKLELLHRAAMETCDGNDGVRDGVIDPPRCKFDPKVLECTSENGTNCLTPPQVKAAQEIYTGPVNARTGQQIYRGFFPGSELGWAQLIGLERTGFSGPEGFRLEAYETFRHLVFKDPNWTFAGRPVNFDSDVALADSPQNRLLDGIRNTKLTDLGKFVERGGKVFLHAGWADTGVPSAGIIDYYNKAVEKLGPELAKNSIRLFMVPGMGHCPGTNGSENFNFNTLQIIQQWRETGEAPNRLIVSRHQNNREIGKRLVCPYPQSSVYKGTGNTDDPENFVCMESK